MHFKIFIALPLIRLFNFIYCIDMKYCIYTKMESHV
ncbi:hypothetical protein ACJIZ3_007937 [Penstemon smallii]|uniref:Uncharacterized protein n=1 Tax=Penstemon smallii TaxID=265156 RepID=A0ABD3T9A0_9LAMI